MFIKGGRDRINVLKKCLKLFAYLTNLIDFTTLIVITTVNPGLPCIGLVKEYYITRETIDIKRIPKSILLIECLK